MWNCRHVAAACQGTTKWTGATVIDAATSVDAQGEGLRLRHVVCLAQVMP